MNLSGATLGEEKFLKNRGRILVMDLVSVFLIIFELFCGPIFIWNTVENVVGGLYRIVLISKIIRIFN